ncbi:AfsR/SARP family transcriptional regulator [Kitasatospora sp. NPDC096140]|uniref:AfsR/SARP family transcriptional regulator n=1 Tax=unclassified Kitasatospora TaxID=2633591 RepID=UPI003329DC9E
MDFKVLGPLEVSHLGCPRTPSPPKTRQLLALLLLRVNQVVSLDSIITELWDDRPPRSAVTTAQTYIYQLRKAFAAEVGEEAAGHMISTVLPGYVLRIDERQLDAPRFDRLVEDARLLNEDGEPLRAAGLLADALAMWRGPALSNVSCGPVLASYATHLEERRISALEARVRTDMELGRHRRLVAELQTLVSTYPFNEWFHTQLILALNRSGRRGDALNAYQRVRRLLGEELGLDPSAELQRVHQQVLRVDGPAVQRMPVGSGARRG